MAAIFYGSTFAFSILCSLIYLFIWHKHFNVNLTLIFAFIPLSCLGYYMLGLSKTAGEALAAIYVIYLGGCFLPFFILYCIIDFCRIRKNRWVTLFMFLICLTEYFFILTTEYTGFFYKEYSMEFVDGNPVHLKVYGFMHYVFFAVTLVFIIAGLSIIIYSWIIKKQVPRTIVALLTIPYLTSVTSYFFVKIVHYGIEIVPLGYVLAQITYIIIARRSLLYDVAETVADSMAQEEALGFISFDFRYRYLGSNSFARKLLPSLEQLPVDAVFGHDPAESTIIRYLEDFKNDPAKDQFVYTQKGKEDGSDPEERFYNGTINYLYDGLHKCGFIITFKDDTENRKYMQLLNTYNDELQSEVEEKTKHIVEMHNNLIMGLATMVESRDNSTGGHIKRTSEGVRILVEEIVKEQSIPLSEKFCADVIKAAPMHDLGKIAVDDAVLRKPGKFTDEEFAKMKKHSEEGARVIHEILLNTDDEPFKILAENVAHYHHERWDGSGYPEGKKGTEIPLEARIMAIADVYDALVSKRVYKEAFDFEKADAIIIAEMGKQFDPGLKSAYQKARPRLEEYYGTDRAG